uniref:Uncharacterized protein n=1 Tax=Glossina brevipalpis TaxID=37001 RepID=A0A1A9W9Q1_9MUSC
MSTPSKNLSLLSYSLLKNIHLTLFEYFNSACTKIKIERSFQYQRQIIRTIRISSQETLGRVINNNIPTAAIESVTAQRLKYSMFSLKVCILTIVTPWLPQINRICPLISDFFSWYALIKLSSEMSIKPVSDLANNSNNLRVTNLFYNDAGIHILWFILDPSICCQKNQRNFHRQSVLRSGNLPLEYSVEFHLADAHN